MLRLAWAMSPSLTVAFYSTGVLGALAPIGYGFTMKWILDSLVGAQPTATIGGVVLTALVGRYLINAAESAIGWGLHKNYFDYLFRYRLQNEIATRFHRKLAYLDVAHLEDASVQDLIAKARDTITTKPPEFLRQLGYLLGWLASFVTAVIVLLPFGVWIPLVICASTLPRFYLRTKYSHIEWSIYSASTPKVRRLWYIASLLTTPAALQELKLLREQEAMLRRLVDTQDELYASNKANLNRHLRLVFFPPIFEAAVLLAIAVHGLHATMMGALSIGSLTLLITLIDRLSDSAVASVITTGSVYENNLYVDHFFDVLELPRVVDQRTPRSKLPPRTAPPTIEFRDVRFAYPGTAIDVLRGVSFTMPPGKTLALVGANGAGKTTIIKLLCRFYDVTSGAILIDGVDIREIDLDAWQASLGTLFQDFVKYHFTVREVITLGAEQRDDDRLQRAAEDAGAWPFIQMLPRGVDQQLGREFEGGADLSPGQWQKLAIARALYANRPVLILDEPTSAIDAAAEAEIFERLSERRGNKSLLVVSHRFSTVKTSDHIIVLRDGTIAEEGTHDDLLARGREYARMYLAQAKHYVNES